MFDILVTQTFLKLTSVNWRFTSALITSKLVKNDCNFIPGKSEFFRQITQSLTRYCWWRAKHYSFTFISLTSSLPAFFSNLMVTNTLSQPNMHLCACLFTTLFFFFPAHKCDYTGHQPQMSHPVPLSVKCSSTLSALGQLYHAQRKHTFLKTQRLAKTKKSHIFCTKSMFWQERMHSVLSLEEINNLALSFLIFLPGRKRMFCR